MTVHEIVDVAVHNDLPWLPYVQLVVASGETKTTAISVVTSILYYVLREGSEMSNQMAISLSMRVGY